MSLHIIRGTRINSDDSDCAALYDFTTGQVLPTPILEDEHEAEALLEWCQRENFDLRLLGAEELETTVKAFRDAKCPGCNVQPNEPHRFSCATHGAWRISLPATLVRGRK